MATNKFVTIDEVIAILGEQNLERIQGSIIFPSHPITIPIEKYAGRLGLLLVAEGQKNSYDKRVPHIYHPFGENPDYSVEFGSVESFQTAIDRFRLSNQLPPYFMLAEPGTDRQALIAAQNAKLRSGRIKEYLYEVLFPLGGVKIYIGESKAKVIRKEPEA